VHRLVVRTITIASLAALVAGGTLTAHAKNSRPKNWGGKKAIGTVLTFDPATRALTIDMTEGDDFTGTLAEDAQVKLDHRGHSRRGEGHGNPTRGSLEDLTAGAGVLRMKSEDGVVTKIRLRPAAPVTPPTAPEDEGESEDAAPGDDDPADDTAEDEADETEDTDTDDTDTPDEDSSGDVEDALPSLPVPLP
jgi:hypothetical protein